MSRKDGGARRDSGDNPRRDLESCEPMRNALNQVQQPDFASSKIAPFDPTSFVAEGRDAILRTTHGALYDLDCIEFLSRVADDSVDTVFADPPFNLGKIYGPGVNDLLTEAEYVGWSKLWIAEAVRTLKPGGSFFLYNLPKWNVLLGAYLTELGMEFRHWIAISMKAGLPIAGRLYPAHYSMLYFSKGKPKKVGKIRTPIQICRHCGGHIKDYGGHRGAMNPDGVNLTDVWTDIPPVRHRKFKDKKRVANQLSTKLLERVVHISTEPGDLVIDPFGGSGTTFDVCERLDRCWLGTEIENCDVIVSRMVEKDIALHPNDDWIEADQN